MKTFKLKKNKQSHSLLYTILSFTLIFALLVPSLQSILDSTKTQQKASLEKALQRGIVQCYALEGSYPQSLEYLLSHYGIVYDKDLFFVDYQPVAENIKPSITIIQLH